MRTSGGRRGGKSFFQSEDPPPSWRLSKPSLRETPAPQRLLRYDEAFTATLLSLLMLINSMVPCLELCQHNTVIFRRLPSASHRP